MSQEQPSKAKRVQEYLRANPQSRNRDIVKALSEYGVTPADVSNAKTQLKKKYTRRRTRAAAVAAASVSAGEPVSEECNTFSIVELEATIDFAQSVGGIVRAQQLLAIIHQIQEL